MKKKLNGLLLCDSPTRTKLLRKMKLLSFLLFLSVASFASITYSQQAKFTLNYENITVGEVFQEIEKNSEFIFVYSEKTVDLTRTVTVSADDENIEYILDQIFRGTNNYYEINDRQIAVLSKKTEEAPVESKDSSKDVQDQKKTVTGKVTDSKEEPLPGVTVIVKGTTIGITTDFDGNYTLDIPASAEILMFSFVGMKSQEIAIGTQTQINVTLEDETIGLDEVVAVGYGVQKKSSVTGAISSISSEALSNRTITRTEQALQGKTAGVQMISTSSQPGASPSIRIRGFSSNGTSDPLYVVDGLIVEDIGGIDPNSIESIEVLKDAASAAIYGAQAGNGVVLITTKTGSKGSSSITYDFQYAVSNLANRPKLLNSEQAIEQNLESGNFTSPDQVQSLITDGVWDGKFSTDWYDVGFEASPMTRHTLSMQGANDNGSFFFSLANLNNEGIITGDRDYYKRFSGMVNADYNVTPWFKVGTNTNIEKYERMAISDGSSNSIYNSMISAVMSLAPYWASTYPSDALPTQMQSQLASGWNLFTDENDEYYMTLGSGEAMHPKVSVLANDEMNSGTNILGTIYANFTPVDGLVYTTRLGYRLGNNNYYRYTNDYYGSGSVNSERNSATRSNTTNDYIQWENFVNYNKSFEVHDFSAMAGMSYIENDMKYVYASVDQVMKDDPLYADVSYGAGDATNSVQGYNLINRKLSYFGRLGYTYARKYILQASFRADAADTSVLPEENRWGYFPSFSTGWVMSDENFFKDLGETPFTHVKLRASWGQNGSTSNLTNYMYSNSITTAAAGYTYSTSPVYQISASPSQTYNPKLKWETSEQLDFGLDFRAFNDRLTYTMDWFKKETKDLIVSQITIPFEVGNTSAPMNAGNVKNTGFEFELNWKDHYKDLTYSVNANIATLNNEVTYLSPLISDGRIYGSSTQAAGGSFSAFEVGYPVWYFYGYQVDHIDETGAPVYVDNSGDGEIDANDKTNIGKPMPDFTYGFTLNLEWKGLDFLLFGSGAKGNDVFMALGYNTVSYQLAEIYNDRWTEKNSTNAKYAKPGTSGDKYRVSDAYVFNGSYFKIRQIQLGYTIPKQIAKKLFVENLRAYVSLDDWFTFTKYPGLDPEVSATATSGMGVDYGNYPTTRKTVFGLSVTF